MSARGGGRFLGGRHDGAFLRASRRGRGDDARGITARGEIGQHLGAQCFRFHALCHGIRGVDLDAKARGLRVVGIAGGPEKCKYAVDELHFDECIDYRQHPDVKTMSKALKDACPNGIDGYFENVGGYILDAVLLRTNAFARIALCGMIAGYDGQPLPLQNPALILVNRLTIEGFIVSEHMEVWPEALKELGTLVATGQLKPRETIAEGIESAPEAFLGLLKGKNFGKQLVKLI